MTYPFIRNRRVLAFFGLASLSILAACGGSDNDNTGGIRSGSTGGDSQSAPADFFMDCFAEVQGGTHIQYVLSGSSVSFSANGQTVTLPRGAGGDGKSIYGTWNLPIDVATRDPALAARYQLKVEGTLVIEAGRITATSKCSNKWMSKMIATASSPATITDSTIDILESHHQRKRWTPRGGETTVNVGSIDPFGPLGSSGDAEPGTDAYPSAEVNAAYGVTLGMRFPFAAD